jgi:tRNA-splicing ligase RtcB
MLKIHSWCPDIEESALKQIENLQKHPGLVKHIAIMPDCHCGYGMPIGGVIATKEVIIPNAVGVDIGCGMCYTKTNIKVSDISKDNIKSIMQYIRGNVPVGFKKREDPCILSELPNLPHTSIIGDEINNARVSLGTLGGGNHFIELQETEEGFLSIMIHSGSRNLGYKTAEYYNKIAIELNKKWLHNFTVESDMAFLPLDTVIADNYILDMRYCIEFAKLNRDKMMEDCKDGIKKVLGSYNFNTFDTPHNYAALEHHMGDNVWIHRKGATRARKGELGIIPGSQGTSSYIILGKGNVPSFNSCSHGAGRKMSRKKAREELNIEDEKNILDTLGVVHSIRSNSDLDEAPSAYKDIEDVMKNQEDLVEIVTRLKPLAVIKG